VTARSPKALVVDDIPDVRHLVASALRRDGFEVTEAPDGPTEIELTRADGPDLIVLDIMMPGMDGTETCRRLREFTNAYIIMLTAKSEEPDKLVGLGMGADDYMTKPFSPRELVARARTMLRRPRSDAGVGPVREFGGIRIDPGAREVSVDGSPIDLTRTEFNLLDLLSASPRTVLSRETLVQSLWGGEWFSDDHVLDVHMSSLRRKLGDDPKAPRFVHTVRGVGYRFVGDVA
jgi:DNA-binding response OmpR family regulator